MAEHGTPSALEILQAGKIPAEENLPAGLALANVILDHIRKEDWPSDSAAAIHLQRALDNNCGFIITVDEALERAHKSTGILTGTVDDPCPHDPPS